MLFPSVFIRPLSCFINVIKEFSTLIPSYYSHNLSEGTGHNDWFFQDSSLKSSNKRKDKCFLCYLIDREEADIKKKSLIIPW